MVYIVIGGGETCRHLAVERLQLGMRSWQAPTPNAPSLICSSPLSFCCSAPTRGLAWRASRTSATRAS